MSQALSSSSSASTSDAFESIFSSSLFSRRPVCIVRVGALHFPFSRAEVTEVRPYCFVVPQTSNGNARAAVSGNAGIVYQKSCGIRRVSYLHLSNAFEQVVNSATEWGPLLRGETSCRLTMFIAEFVLAYGVCPRLVRHHWSGPTPSLRRGKAVFVARQRH